MERTLYSLAGTVEANDVPGVLSYLGPNATKALREDVETLMPLVRIERARIIGAPEIEVSPDGASATAKCRGIIMAVSKRDGMKGGGDDRFVLEWIRSGDRWLLENYTSTKDWNRAAGKPQREAK